MPDTSEESIARRKRVARACETCRLMKSKCNGGRPSCDRCTGYGYRCIYVSGKRGRALEALVDNGPSPAGSAASAPTSPTSKRPRTSSGDGRPGFAVSGACSPVQMTTSGVAAEFEELVRDAVRLVPDQRARERLLARLAGLSERVAAGQNVGSPSSGSIRVPGTAAGSPTATMVSGESPALAARALRHPQRYLGEVSDVRFFNLVKRVLQPRGSVSGPGAGGAAGSSGADDGGAMDSYELDDPSAVDAPTDTLVVELPAPEVAEKFLEAYFSTIHLAYPFVQRSVFMRTYAAVRESGSAEAVDRSWVALLYILFAIGAYYTTFPGEDKDKVHEHYLQRALALSNMHSTERSTNQVSFLLAECFYLLAVCRTDRCWTTLGVAIRLAQSIGLHVEPESGRRSESQPSSSSPRYEIRRRLWYCLYVLDRLLSLQLGRPPAIHDDDFGVALPSRLEDSAIAWDDDTVLLDEPSGPSTGDYFLGVIRLSRIIGFVLRDLYAARRLLGPDEELRRTQLLDRQLLEWKAQLPRTLRFDFGHAFEASVTFKRQRNNLAVKFHHLRALIHRPYLCLPVLRHPDDAWAALLQSDAREQMARCERICVSEAQETAHLMHNVAGEKELVHDFPWWQMISCLICASSILLVSSIFSWRETGTGADELDEGALHDDAETCLKVFEALSPNSEGARIARDMMARLKERGLQWREAHGRELPAEPVPGGHGTLKQDLGHQVTPVVEGVDSLVMPQFDMAFDAAFFEPGDLPAEILNSLTWSAQFFDAVQPMS